MGGVSCLNVTLHKLVELLNLNYIFHLLEVCPDKLCYRYKNLRAPRCQVLYVIQTSLMCLTFLLKIYHLMLWNSVMYIHAKIYIHYQKLVLRYPYHRRMSVLLIYGRDNSCMMLIQRTAFLKDTRQTKHMSVQKFWLMFGLITNSLPNSERNSAIHQFDLLRVCDLHLLYYLTHLM